MIDRPSMLASPEGPPIPMQSVSLDSQAPSSSRRCNDPAAESVSDDAAPVTGPAHAGTIAVEPGKSVDAVDIAARAATERATDAPAHAVSDHGSKVAEVPDIQASFPAPQASAPRRHRNRAAEAVAKPQLANAPAVTAQAVSLDDEIKLLRRELIRKLRLQNAQFKTMLERFER